MGNFQNRYNSQLILELCCNFVTLDDDFGRFSFVHAFVREYLQQLPEYSMSICNFIAAQRCLEFFIFDDEDGIDSDQMSLSPDDSIGVGNGHSDFWFCEYAICHWAYHYLKADDITVNPKLDAILAQFVSEKETMTFSQWLEDVRELVESKRLQPTHLKDLIAILNDYGSPIFVACIYGISSILHKVQDEASCIGRTVNYNAKNAQGASALYLSTRNGRTNSLRFLLDHGASIDQSGGFFFWKPAAGSCIPWARRYCAYSYRIQGRPLRPWKIHRHPWCCTSPFEVATCFCLAHIPLDHSRKFINRHTNHNISKPNLGWDTAADTNHKTRFNGWKSVKH